MVAFTQDRATWREQRQGPLTHTGNPFDLALSSDGYFSVRTPNGVRLTRDGQFGLAPDGTLADGSGNAVLDSSGQPIKLSPTEINVAVSGDGTISGATGQLAKIGVVKPNDPNRLQAEGGTLLNAIGGTTAIATPSVVQGAVEQSNVEPVMEVTRMMTELREFQFTAQLIQAEADRQQGAIDKILSQRN